MNPYSRSVTTAFRQGLTLTLVGVALATGHVSAADLDPAFGTSGKVTTDVAGRFDEIRALMIQSDGRIVAAGVTGAAPHRDFALARYNTDGTLDPAFGDGGTVTTDFAGGDDDAWALAIQLDGKIVVGGLADRDFGFARYSVNGVLDAQFGVGGRTLVDFRQDDRIYALALQSDGKIVAAGMAGGRYFAIARLNTNGTPDATFGLDGRLITEFSGGPAAAFAVAMRPDGKIVAAGSAGSFPAARFAVAQYNDDGSLDEAFAVGGRTIIEFDKDARAHALALFEDGKLLIGGIINNGSSADGVFARLTALGAVDGSFGVHGRLETDFGGRHFGSTLALQVEGPLIVAGSDDFPPYYDFAIARYEPDGGIDVSFNRDGAVVTEFGGNSGINAVAVQRDGKIIAAGQARGDFALVRYQSGR